MQLFPKHATRFEVQHTLIASADEEQVKTKSKNSMLQMLCDPYRQVQVKTTPVASSLPVVDYFYGSILLDPEFPQDNIVHTTQWVCPRVCFFMSARELQKVQGV